MGTQRITDVPFSDEVSSIFTNDSGKRRQIDLSAFSSLLDFSPIINEKSGEIIIATDSSNAKFRGMNVYGKSKQYSTTGKNLSPITEATAEADSYFIPMTNIDLKSGTYTFSMKPSSTSGSFLLAFFNASGSVIGKIETTNAVAHGTVTLAEDATAYRGYTNIANTYRNIQLEKGSVATESEKYTGGKASPSPQYPQTVENCENTEVSVYGGNLFGGNSEETPQYDGHNYCDLGGKYGFNADYNAFVIPIIENKSYYFWGNFADTSLMIFHYLNSDREVISTYTSLYGKKEGIIPALANAKFIRFSLKTTDKMNIMLNMGTEALPYETYKEKQSLTIPYTLCGIPVSSGGNYTDDNGQEWLCDEVDMERGVYVQRIVKRIYNGQGEGRFKFESSEGLYALSPVSYGQMNYKSICNMFKMATSYTTLTTMSECAGLSKTRLMIKTDSFANAEELNAFLSENNMTVYFALETPIETPLTAEQIAAYKALHSNYPTTTILTNNGAGMMVKYGADTKLYIDNKFAELAAQLV